MPRSPNVSLKAFTFMDASTLWNSSGEQTLSLGCSHCAYRIECGGLSVSAAVFDCESLCHCTDVAKCTKVCPKNGTHLVKAMKEVHGLKLETVPRVGKLPSVDLPRSVPFIYHAGRREEALHSSTVALSLYQTFDRTGRPRYATPDALRKAFKLDAATRIVLSGTATDPPLERLWALPDRRAFFRSLTELGIELLTTPNFSLICDIPRVDDLHNMKRIAIAHAEVLGVGVPAALHVNARTERDYERWAKYIEERDEIEWIAFEFGTGAGRPTRQPFHMEQLVDLAKFVRRPLRLIVRGGMGELVHLAQSFAQVTLIDTTSFMKTHMRQRAVRSAGKLCWEAAPTVANEPLDNLLAHNVGAVAENVNAMFR